jgi:hypothetical protein
MARVRSIAMVCGLAALAAPAMAQFPEPASLDPVPLFKQMCTNGGGHLPGKVVTRQDYRRMPPNAREALSLGAPFADHRAGTLFDPLPVSDVPNDVYRIGSDGETYLFIAKPDERGVMSASCAVVWKGNHFGDARRAITDIAGLAPNDSSIDSGGTEGIQAFGIAARGYEIKSAMVDGWTVLRATPDVTRNGTPVSPSTGLSPQNSLQVHQKSNGETVVSQ